MSWLKSTFSCSGAPRAPPPLSERQELFPPTNSPRLRGLACCASCGFAIFEAVAYSEGVGLSNQGKTVTAARSL